MTTKEAEHALIELGFDYNHEEQYWQHKRKTELFFTDIALEHRPDWTVTRAKEILQRYS